MSNINYLPLNIQSRVELYLTENDLKPSCIISLRNETVKTKEKVENYLYCRKLFFEVDKKNPCLYFISPEREVVMELISIWNQNNQEADERKGTLLGYPKAPTQAFAKFSIHQDRSKYLTSITDEDFPRGIIPHWPYIGYIVRKGFEVQDSEISKKWSDFIRENNPVLAKWYEKIMMAASK